MGAVVGCLPFPFGIIPTATIEDWSSLESRVGRAWGEVQCGLCGDSVTLSCRKGTRQSAESILGHLQEYKDILIKRSRQRIKYEIRKMLTRPA